MSRGALCIVANESFVFRLLQQLSLSQLDIYSLQSCSDLVGVAMVVS